MKVERTGRGFEIIKFKDHYKENCSLQQSSLAIFEEPGTSAIWLGIDSVDVINDNKRMHLTHEQVLELLRHLNSWAETGSFEYKESEEEKDD